MTKEHDIRPGQSTELLKALHILTRDGKMNLDSRRKIKQVNHLVQFIEPLIKEKSVRNEPVTLVDHGAGKSYLGFLLYDLCLQEIHQDSRIIGIETREELVRTSRSLADKCGFRQMRFYHLSAADSICSPNIPEQIDIVTALHACDTATDDAIAFGLAKGVRHMVLVPCCQAEVAAELKKTRGDALKGGGLAELWRQPIHTREFGSHLTNVLRTLQLQAHGYKVQVTELVGWEHSMKNELIIATATGQQNRQAGERLVELLKLCRIESLAGRFFLPE